MFNEWQVAVEYFFKVQKTENVDIILPFQALLSTMYWYKTVLSKVIAFVSNC